MLRKLMTAAIVTLALFAAWWLWVHPSEQALGEPEASTKSISAESAASVAEAQPTSPILIAPELRSSAPIAAADSPPARVPLARVLGRVVDAAHFPAQTASIELHIPGSVTLKANSGADGRFEIGIFGELPDPKRPALLVARDGAGAIARTLVWTGRWQRAEDSAAADALLRNTSDVGKMVLQPSCSIEVLVTDAGRPAIGAALALEIDLGLHTEVARLNTDALGRACAELLPAGLLRIRAALGDRVARKNVFLPADAETQLELEPAASYDVEVVEAGTNTPIAGASIRVIESIAIPAAFGLDAMSSSEVWTVAELHRETVQTDASGRARVAQLELGGRYELGVEAQGYVALPDPQAFPPRGFKLTDPGRAARVELKPTPARKFRWPIIAGELPVPAEGTPLEVINEFAAPWQGTVATASDRGRVEAGELIVEHLSGGRMINRTYLAKTPDGALALLRAGDFSESKLSAPASMGILGEPISFRRPRKLEVLLRNSRGEPMAEASVSVRKDGCPAMREPVWTNAEGRATFEGLHGGVVTVSAVAPGATGQGESIGDVDLEQGDGRLEATLPGSFLARIVLRIDGVPRLPAIFRTNPRAIEEFPERGELLLKVPAAPAGNSSSVLVESEGFLSAHGELRAPTDAAEALLELDLVRAGELFVDVRWAGNQRIELCVQHFDEQTGEWGKDEASRWFAPLNTANGPGGSFRFAEMPSGRWRAIELKSGSLSNEAELTSLTLHARVELSLGVEQSVSGHVEVPAGESPSSVVILVDGFDSSEFGPKSWPGEQPPRGGRVDSSGNFKLRIPGDRDVTLRPWHPWLVPAEDSAITTRVGISNVVLELVAGRELRIPAAAAVQQGARKLRIAAFAKDVGIGVPIWIHAPIVDGVARTSGIASGRWTLWIDTLTNCAPLTLADVEVGAGVTTLAPLALSPGSSLRVRLRVPPGGTAPRTFVDAKSRGEPNFRRSFTSNGESVVVLAGLSAGRYSVRIGHMTALASLKDFEIEVDGMHDVELGYPP